MLHSHIVVEIRFTGQQAELRIEKSIDAFRNTCLYLIPVQLGKHNVIRLQKLITFSIIQVNDRRYKAPEKNIFPILSSEPCYHIIGTDFNAPSNTQGTVNPVPKGIKRLGMLPKHFVLIHNFIKGICVSIQHCTVNTLLIILYRLRDVDRAVCFVYAVNCGSFHRLTSFLVSFSIISYNTQTVNNMRILIIIFRILKLYAYFIGAIRIIQT